MEDRRRGQCPVARRLIGFSVTGADHMALALRALLLGTRRAASGRRRRARQHQHHKHKDEFHGHFSLLHSLTRGSGAQRQVD
jgi:hypothetical protein